MDDQSPCELVSFVKLVRVALRSDVCEAGSYQWKTVRESTAHNFADRLYQNQSLFSVSLRWAEKS